MKSNERTPQDSFHNKSINFNVSENSIDPKKNLFYQEDSNNPN